MTNAVKTGSDIALQDPLRGMLSGQHIEALFDRICSGALRPEAIGVGVAERFSDGIEREEVQRLHRPIGHRRNRQGTLASRAIRFGNVNTPQRQGAIAMLPEGLNSARFLGRGVPHEAIDTWGPTAVVGRHSFDGKGFAAERVGQQMLQGVHLAPSFGLHRLHHTCLEPPHLPVDGVPIDGLPCHRAVGECTSQCRHCRHLLSLLKGLAKVSGDERPDGRLLACAWGDVARGLNPYPSHYRMAFASSILPLPHAYRLALRLAFPRGRRTGFPCSVSVTGEWVRRALSTGSVYAHDKERGSPCARYVAVLAQAFQHLWLVFFDDVYQAFTWVRPTIHPSPS